MVISSTGAGFPSLRLIDGPVIENSVEEMSDVG
jgi:hypothetical protein